MKNIDKKNNNIATLTRTAAHWHITVAPHTCPAHSDRPTRPFAFDLAQLRKVTNTNPCIQMQ
jgi:hypothetical protein